MLGWLGRRVRIWPKLPRPVLPPPGPNQPTGLSSRPALPHLETSLLHPSPILPNILCWLLLANASLPLSGSMEAGCSLMSQHMSVCWLSCLSQGRKPALCLSLWHSWASPVKDLTLAHRLVWIEPLMILLWLFCKIIYTIMNFLPPSVSLQWGCLAIVQRLWEKEATTSTTSRSNN